MANKFETAASIALSIAIGVLGALALVHWIMCEVC